MPADDRSALHVGKSKAVHVFELVECEGQLISPSFTWAVMRAKATGAQRCFFADLTCSTPDAGASLHKCQCGNAMYNLCTQRYQTAHFKTEADFGKFYCYSCIV